MDIIEKIQAVSETLKTLFAEDGQLHGFDDWDRLIGCVMMLDNVTLALMEKNESEVVSDG